MKKRQIKKNKKKVWRNIARLKVGNEGETLTTSNSGKPKWVKQK